MTKETKWLLIFAGIFLVVGVIASLAISSYSSNVKRQKELRDYKEFFPKMADVVEVKDFEATEVVIKKEEVLDKDKKAIGYAYTATITVENTIPGKASAELKLLVGVGLDDKVAGVKTLLSEHTPDFYDKYEAEYAKLANSLKNDYVLDAISGSTVSAGVINDILKEVKTVHLGIVLTSYEVVFGEGAVGVIDETFVGNEIVTEKVAVSDADGNLLGYAYVGTITGTTLAGDKTGDLTVLVGINSELKIVGITEILMTHTSGFYNDYLESLAGLKGKNVSELSVNSVTGSTISGTTLNQIFDAIKEVISNE